jgi:hypothetical protein
LPGRGTSQGTSQGKTLEEGKVRQVGVAQGLLDKSVDLQLDGTAR